MAGTNEDRRFDAEKQNVKKLRWTATSQSRLNFSQQRGWQVRSKCFRVWIISRNVGNDDAPQRRRVHNNTQAFWQKNHPHLSVTVLSLLPQSARSPSQQLIWSRLPIFRFLIHSLTTRRGCENHIRRPFLLIEVLPTTRQSSQSW